MSVAEIPYEFISQRVELGWNEIKFGLEQQLIKPKAAIERATEQLCSTDIVPKEVVELASSSESESVADLVSSLAKAEATPTNELMKAKWLYLVLAWLFENRESLVDPLQIVENIYSDFDYPQQIVSFIRYMPTQEHDLRNREQNEARMFGHWKTYLDETGKRFARTTFVSGSNQCE